MNGLLPKGEYSLLNLLTTDTPLRRILVFLLCKAASVHPIYFLVHDDIQDQRNHSSQIHI